MAVHPPSVSVVDPISPAMSRVKKVLFSPFDLRKWFAIGFCAWLSSCGETGGGNGNFNYSNRNSTDRGDLREGLENAWQYVLDNLIWILPVIIGLILFGVGIWLLALWLNSRGKFMLLHCVARNRGEIRVPWDTYAPQANSLFVFQILLGVIAFLVLFPLVVGSIAVILLALMGEGSLVGPILLAVGGILCAVAFGLLVGAVKRLLEDFVVPIMYQRALKVQAAWQEFLPLMKANLWRFVGYLLFSVVIAIIIATIVFVLVIATCCIACCILIIPYLGTVLILPLFVFRRAYSLYYLEQYGPDYTVISPDSSIPPLSPQSPGGLQPV